MKRIPTTYTSLSEETAFYDKHFGEYRQKYAGRFLLIHGSKLIGDYEDEMDACNEGYRQMWRTGPRTTATWS